MREARLSDAADRHAGRVARLWRYPVKSMLGEPRESLDLDAGGVAGDRTYAVRTADGKLGSGKNTGSFRQIDGLLDFRASYLGAVPCIRFPDGRVIGADEHGLDAALSAALGRTVTLARAGDTGHVDAGPVHLLTTASLAWLQARLPGSRIDERRFRPNLVIDVPGETPVEQGWIGKTLALGSHARLRIQGPTERCRMVTLAQPDLPEDAGVLRGLAGESDLMFGVYAEIRTPGRIGVGDPVVVI